MYELCRLTAVNKPHVFSYTANFARCREKQAEQPKNKVIEVLDFMSMPQKAVESKPIFAETLHTDNANLPLSPRETSESALEDTPAIVTLDNEENSENSHESNKIKQPVSNFAKAKLC